MRDRIFIFAVLAVVCTVLAGYAYAGVTGGPQDRINFGLGGGPHKLPDRVKAIVKSPALRSLLSAAPQAKITDAMRKNLLGFDQIILGVAAATTSADRAFYRAFLPGQALVPVGMNAGDSFVSADGERLVQVFLTSEVRPDFTNEIDAARSLATMFPGVHFSYYMVTSFAMTGEARAAGYVDPAVGFRDRFAARLSGVATVGSLDLAPWGDAFYKTDHHWNAVGAYQGYLDVMRLLSRGRPDLDTARVPFSSEIVPGVAFRGSLARTAAVGEWQEPLDVLVFDAPALETVVNGRTLDVAAARQKYMRAAPKGYYRNHYQSYYGADVALRSFRMRGAAASAGRLLVLSDSYGRSMVPLVATHFAETFYVDLRFWKSKYGKAFDMGSFVAEHGITDVLTMGRPTRVMSTPAAILRGKTL